MQHDLSQHEANSDGRNALSCTPVPSIVRKARDFNRQENVEAGNLPFGHDVIHNAQAGGYPDRPNLVEYDIALSANANYDLHVEYAALIPRPCSLYWDGKLIASAHLGSSTGGWEEQFQRWEKQGVVSGGPGVHQLRIESGGVFPHIRTIRLDIVTPP